MEYLKSSLDYLVILFPHLLYTYLFFFILVVGFKFYTNLESYDIKMPITVAALSKA
jgi:hypothetical protein